jgi:hypothetical protein
LKSQIGTIQSAVAAAALPAHSKMKNRSTLIQRIERSLALWRRAPFWETFPRMPVSPFDGANRIRFKGSPTLPIFNCRLPICFLILSLCGWRPEDKLAIGN